MCLATFPRRVPATLMSCVDALHFPCRRLLPCHELHAGGCFSFKGLDHPLEPALLPSLPSFLQSCSVEFKGFHQTLRHALMLPDASAHVSHSGTSRMFPLPSLHIYLSVTQPIQGEAFVARLHCLHVQKYSQSNANMHDALCNRWLAELVNNWPT